MTMPHVNSGGTDDFYSSDEVKVYQHEGEEENEKRSSENLSEDKYGLVTETEEDKGTYTGNKSDRRTEDGKPPSQGDRDVPFGYLPNYPPYPNGSTPTTMGGKVPMLQSPLGVMMGYNNDTPFTSPPPAHMGIPPVTIDPKTGLPRHVYPYPTSPGQFPPSLYPDVQWQRPPGYPISSGALGGHYPPNFVNTTARYPHGVFPPGFHPGMSHPMVAGPKQEVSDNQRHGFSDGGSQSPQPEKKKPHIKKPLNAFMLFMKEQRAKVVAECTLKESAAINQILGRRWHGLDRSEQAKYYEMARKEKELHQQLYPGWSARDNYAAQAKKKKRKKELHLPPDQDRSEQAKYYEMARKEKDLHLQMYPGWSARDNYGSHTKKKKRQRERQPESTGEKGMRCTDRTYDNPAFGDCTNSKKCRARYGMDQQKNWCKPCRRKKKCIRVYGNDQDTDGEDDGDSDSNSVHDSDSVMGSPACSSASEDVFMTPQKSLSRNLNSPLIGHSSPLHSSDMDCTLKAQDVLPGHRSPFSVMKPDRGFSDNRFTPERYLSPGIHIPSMSSPASVKSDSSHSYSIDALAKSSVKSSDKNDLNSSFECVLSPLSSPGDFGQTHSPKFSLSTFAEDINKNLSPKKKPSGLSSSFSISTLSVSAVTPSQVHCS